MDAWYCHFLFAVYHLVNCWNINSARRSDKIYDEVKNIKTCISVISSHKCLVAVETNHRHPNEVWSIIYYRFLDMSVTCLLISTANADNRFICSHHSYVRTKQQSTGSSSVRILGFLHFGYNPLGKLQFAPLSIAARFNVLLPQLPLHPVK